jgi:class 3 adenylate cyclase
VTLDDLARRTGEPVEQLRHWRALGLIGIEDELGSDTERIRLIQFARRRGIAPDDIAEVSRRQGDVLATFIDLLVQTTGKRQSQPRAEALASLDIDPVFAARAWNAAGIADQTELFEDDVEALHWMEQARQAGFPDEAIIQLLRVYTDALSRVAEAENRLFHYYVHEQFRRDGITGRALMEATSSVSQSLVGLVEPALLYFHRKAWEQALREDLILHLMEDVTGEPPAIPGMLTLTTMFIDLASFTTLTSALGDEAGAQMLDRFSELVRQAAVRYDGKLVKQIGDAFMLVFGDATDALHCGLDVRDAAASEPDFPAVRLGAHTGEVLYREGDYVGTNINIAARVAALAERGQFAVTASTRRAADINANLRYDPLGPHHLKGIPEDIEVFDAHRTTQ